MKAKNNNKLTLEAIEKLLQKEALKNRIYMAAEFAKMDVRFNDLEDKISHLPSKQEFYDKMDQVMGERPG